jgi:hypothetical protein
MDQAAESKGYCDEVNGTLQEAGIEPIDLASYLMGQVLAVHPAYETMFQPFFPEGLTKAQRVAWAADQLRKTVTAPVNMGTMSYLVYVRRGCLAHDISLATAA